MLGPHTGGSPTSPQPWTSDEGGLNGDGQGGMANPPRGEPEYIMRLVEDLRRFADVLLSLKDAFLAEEEPASAQRVVQERLTELLRILRAIIAKHPTLNSTHILSATGNLIAKVKGVNFKEVNKENKETIFGDIHTSIDSLAFTFGNVVSDFLMGDVDSTSNLGLSKSRSLSFDNLTSDAGEYGRGTGDVTGPLPDVDVSQLKNGRGVESALLYAKAWSKYTKDLLAWVDKRISLDIECAKGLAKMAESAKTLFSQQDYMPFREIYISAFKKDVEYSQLLLQTAAALQTNKFIQPLLSRRAELDKLRKELKEQWQREQKRMHEAEALKKKAYQLQVQRREEYEKARGASSRTDEEQTSGGRQRDKRRRLEEEALLKTEEALEQYKVCVAEAENRKAALASTQSGILTQIRELLFQCDLTLKAVTVNLFQLHRAQASSLPATQHSLSERARRYQPGQSYTHFLSSLPREHTHLKTRSYDLTSLGSRDEVDELRSASQRRASGGDFGGGGGSDSESAGGSSESHSIDSPVASPETIGRGLPRTPSTGTMSSADDLDVRDPDNGLGDGQGEMASSTGPFQNVQMSKAAQTHRLRRLRAPTKCRECDGLVVFHGAECEECSLACHKKCLESLSIQCGHRKLQGRLALFGVDFSMVARGSNNGIPFIIRKCAAEVESRALTLKGIYRVNGAKSRVEKLCQAFENGKELVELSDHSPHDISNVLKLYLRQLPEPLIQYRFYNDVIGIAKETQKIVMVEAAAEQDSSGQSLTTEVECVVLKLRDLLRHLPSANYKTLHFLLAHLYRVSEQEEENKMSASNLGIIFGPTLVRARQTGAEVSLSSLVDYPYQALAVELLIRYHQSILPLPLTSPPPQQGFRRNSHSLLDMKEAHPSRGQHRYSCFPEMHLSDGLQEGTGRLDVEGQRSIRSNRSPELRRLALQQRLPSRPMSMPVSVPVPVPTPACETVSLPVKSQPQPAVPTAPYADVNTNAHEDSLRDADSSAAIGIDDTLTEPRARGEDRSGAAHGEPGVGPDMLPDGATAAAVTDASGSASPGSDVPDSATKTAEANASPTAGVPRPQVHGTVLDTQALRRTWEKEYRPPLLTPRTAMILANLPRPSADTAPTLTSSISTITTSNTSTTSTGVSSISTITTSTGVSSISTIFPRNPYSVSVGRTGPPVAFRAPRTLHPPPGTFYQPPQPPSPTTADTPPALSPTTPSTPSPTSASTRQRLRSSLQELEPREAHFV
ncbi:rho GTPase-activating protein 29-like isoform X1 [Alosa sapidissima]|uniref:rho GTPase-activating protein 29-like isoform X1 n=1 Tax=Alosa sapidissima TaxID=34773 RepID=UPI001C08C92C|nr:rho GTPase-activating protein 29-like isoform X1 [Alosa sapidissima]